MTNKEDFNKFIVSYPTRETIFETYEDAVNYAKEKTSRDIDGDTWIVYKPVAYPKRPSIDMEMITL